MAESGALARGTGEPAGAGTDVRPPLVFSRDNVDLLVDVLDAALAA